MRDSKAGREIPIALALSVIILMVLSSVSGAFYFNSSPNNISSSSDSQNSRTYLVTTTVGNQSYTQYEEVKNGNVIKTWPALLVTISQNVIPTNLSSEVSESSLFSASGHANLKDLVVANQRPNEFPQASSLTALSVKSSTLEEKELSSDHNNEQSPSHQLGPYAPFSATFIIDNPSSGTATMDIGQSITLEITTTNIKNGGPGPFPYQWFENSTGPKNSISGASGTTTNGTIVSYLFEPGTNYANSKPTFYLGLAPTGGNVGGPGTSYSPAITITVNSTPAVSIASSVTIDVGQAYTFTPSITGGTGSFSYQWYLNGSAKSTSSTYTFTPTGTGWSGSTLYLVITDTGTTSGATPSPITATSNTAKITVDSPPTVSITPSSLIIDVGQSVTFTSTVTGGTGTFSYLWYLNGTATSTTTQTYTFIPNGKGTYSIYLVVTDTGTGNAYPVITATSNTAKVTVSADLLVTVTPPSVTMDTGQSVTLTAVASDGTPPYSYLWYENSTATIITTSSLIFTPSGKGSYTFYVAVTDSSSLPATSDSTTVTITVSSPPTVSISPSSAAIDVGQSLSLAPIIVGGTSTFSYAWYESTTSSTSGFSEISESSTYSFTTGTPGTYYFYLIITDIGTGGPSPVITATSKTAAITVNSALTVSISPTFATIDKGQSFTLSGSVTGGSNTYSYSWQVNGVTQSSATTSYTFASTSTGTFTISFLVTDTGVSSLASPNPYVISAIATITVDSPPTVSITPSSPTASVGQSVTFTSTVTGGTGTFSYLWYLNGSATSITSQTYTFIPNGKGTYSIYLVITDTGTGNAYPVITATSKTVALVVAGNTFSVTFNENGLPSGTMWNVALSNGQTFSSSSTMISFPEINGTFYYTITTGNNSYRPSPSAGSFVVAGGAVSTTITFTEVVYTFTITETGLPVGTNWYVNITGSQTSSALVTGSSYHISLPNGTYSYFIATGNKEYSPSPYAGSFSINGIPISRTVTFLLVTYSISFIENGLPAGSNWYVNLTNGQTFLNTPTTISFMEPNGTYSFMIASNNPLFGAYPEVGSFVVKGNSITERISFLRLYSVTIKETGLPLGTRWYLNITDPESFNSTTNSITFFEPNGTYNYTVSSGNKAYQPIISAQNGSFSINGTPVSLPIPSKFVELFSVTFTETNLPSGTTWYLNISDGKRFSSSSPAISLQEPNGTYQFTIATGNKQYRPSVYSGSLEINGTSVSMLEKFYLVTYAVTFSETGFTNGTKWFITLNNVTKQSANGSITFEMVNGTYQFSIQPIPGFATTEYSGNVTVDGSAVTNSLNWTMLTYPIKITQSGITVGDRWSVTLEGTTFNGLSVSLTVNTTKNSIIFQEPNGSYSYTIQPPFGYTGTHMSGSFNVSGVAVGTTASLYPPNFALIAMFGALAMAVLAVGLISLIRKQNRSFFIREERFLKQSKKM